MLPTKFRSEPVTKTNAFSRAMKRLKERGRAVRIGFVIDATASRSGTWETAQTTQARMFRAVAGLRSLSLRLIHYGGNTLTDHGWSNDPRALAAAMAKVRCESGLTQILEALSVFIDGPAEQRTNAVILIGDSFEEDAQKAQALALVLKTKGIKVFAFLEGEDWTAETVFRRFADITGGLFVRLGEELPLADLCEGVALLTADGKRGLKHLGNRRAKQLLLTGPAKS